MYSPSPSTRAHELSHSTKKAWNNAKRAVDHGPGFQLDRWQGLGDWSDLSAEARSDAGLDALEAMDEAIVRLQAARDALSAELLETGVLAPAPAPSEDLSAKTWEQLDASGHFAMSEAELARLCLSEQASDLSDTARRLVPTQSRRAEDLLDAAVTIVGMADDLLTATVIAARARATSWGQIDEIIGHRPTRDALVSRPAEARFAEAIVRWHRGISEPYHSCSATQRTRPNLPNAALDPRRSAQQLDRWVLAHRQPRDYDGGGDTPVSAHTVGATGGDHTSWLISTVLGVSSRGMYRWREPGPVVTRVHAERKVHSLAAAARPGDEQAAETLAAARAQLDELRGSAVAK